MNQGDPELLTTEQVLEVLTLGELEIIGRMADASNATLVGAATLDGASVSCVYKPQRGERPLWDFPDRTLGMREVATYAVSEAGGWHVVPPTVWRPTGPVGAGMAQAWVDPTTDVGSEPGSGLVDVVAQGRLPDRWRHVIDAQEGRGRPVTLAHADDPALRSMALLDAVVNNADRKGGHVLLGRTARDSADRVYGVDHGLTFHEDDKLRTVLWGWAGTELDEAELANLEQLDGSLQDGPLHADLVQLLSDREVDTTRWRVQQLIADGRFPQPGAARHWLPWPAF